MQDTEVEEAILQIAEAIKNTEIKEVAEIATIVVDSYSITSSEAYLLIVAAKLLNKYRKAGSDINTI